MKKKVKIPGMPPITVLTSDEEAENVEYLVCAVMTEEPMFEDNFVGNCCVCGTKVQYRWHAPRKPKKICMQCAVKQMEEEFRSNN
jgi:hypothetical protein